MKCHSLFTRWESGSSCIELNPDPPSIEEARPFYVKISKRGWIPISMLVFARDERHALERIIRALKEMDDTNYLNSYGEEALNRRRARTILEEIEDGSLISEVKSFDISSMSCQVNWASNGGI